MAETLNRTGARRALIVAVLLSLAGCPASKPHVSKTPSPSHSPGVTPSGELRVAYPWEPPTLNPFVKLGDAPAVRELVRPLLPPLFQTTAGGTTEPWLVDRIVAEQPAEVILALRADARWSDGTPISATDVRFTWQTIMERSNPIASREGYDALSDVVATDAHTVVLRFSRAFPRWRDLFSAGLGVLPEHALRGRKIANALRSDWPVSGGPFVLERYTRGLEIVFKASAMPWRVTARVERIHVLFVPDPTTAVQMYRAGKVDVLGPYSSPDYARRIAREPHTTVTSDTGATWVGLVLQTKAAILSDTRVRRAFALATDRDAIVSGLVRGEGRRLNAPFAFPEVRAGSIPFDRTQALRLLDDAGYSAQRNGIRRRGATELTVSIASVFSDELGARIVRALYSRLRDAGFDVNIVELEYEQLWRDWLGSSRVQIALVRFADPPGGGLRAKLFGAEAYPAGAGYSRLADPRLDALIEDPSAAADRAAELVPFVPLYRAVVSIGVKEGVAGIAANASADGLFATAAEWRIGA